MRPEDILKGLNHIDDELIEEAIKEQPVRRKRLWIIPVAAAACMTLLVGYSAVRSGLIGNMHSLSAEQGVQEQIIGSEMQEEEKENAADQEEKEEAAVSDDSDTFFPAASNGAAEQADAGSSQEQTDAGSRILYAGKADTETPAADFHAAGDYTDVYSMISRFEEEEQQESDVVYMTEEAADADFAAEEAAPAENGISAAKSDLAAGTTGVSDTHSATNVMVEGIDESDIVKTDGRFIYRVSGASVIRTDIRDGRPGEESRIEIPEAGSANNIREIFLDEKALVIIGEKTETGDLQQWSEDYSRPYAYQDTTVTFAAVYDISGGTPQYTGMYTQDGFYKTARKKGSHITLFTDVYLYGRVRDEESRKMRAPEEWVPKVNGKMLLANCIYMAEDSYSGILASTFTESTPDTVDDAKFIFLNYAEVYVGSTSVWLYYNDFTAAAGTTKIIRMPYDDGCIRAGKTAEVSGRVTDSFAISEGSGLLRILTSVSGSAGDDNRLYLLDADTLTMTGRLDGIAPGEIIYAARYIENIAYFVTYRNTDPVFAADLSDPADPKIIGELKISGFSDYLHPWDQDHILGLGYETNPVTGEFLGIKMTMFDVSDPYHIKAVETKVLKEGRSSSAIENNYKGILINPQKGIFGFADLEGQEDEAWKPHYRVFTWTPEKGFTDHLNSALKTDDYFSRGIYAGETFYIIDNDVTAFAMIGKEWKVIP